MRRVIVTGAKGGVGTTTVAVSLAVIAARQEKVVLNGVNHHDLAATCGVAYSDGTMEVKPGLIINAHPHVGFDGTLVYDAGVADDAFEFDAGDHVILVVRNYYLALAAAMRVGFRPDRVVAIIEPGRSLDAKDIEDVLGREIVIIDYSPAVARAVDAGLLAVRLPSVLKRVAV